MRATETGAAPVRSSQLRAWSDDEVAAFWENGPPRDVSQRSYIFINEADIVDGAELPLFRVESSRFGTRRHLERMVAGDPGMAARLADLAPKLAGETEMRRRADEAFYTRRPGRSADTPPTPDVIGPAVGVILQALRDR